MSFLFGRITAPAKLRTSVGRVGLGRSARRVLVPLGFGARVATEQFAAEERTEPCQGETFLSGTTLSHFIGGSDPRLQRVFVIFHLTDLNGPRTTDAEQRTFVRGGARVEGSAFSPRRIALL